MDGSTAMQDKLHQAKVTRPFVSFTIVLDDGDKLPVGEPNLFGFSEEMVVVAVPKRGFVRFAMRRVKALEGIADNAA